jgi:hypothetical protein
MNSGMPCLWRLLDGAFTGRSWDFQPEDRCGTVVQSVSVQSSVHGVLVRSTILLAESTRDVGPTKGPATELRARWSQPAHPRRVQVGADGPEPGQNRVRRERMRSTSRARRSRGAEVERMVLELGR